MPTSATCVFHNFLRNLSFLSSIANLFHRREPITLQVSMLNIHMTPAHLCIVLILYFGVDGNQAWLIHHGTIECGGAETFVASVNTCYSFISNWMAGVCGKWIVKELSSMCILLISLIQGIKLLYNNLCPSLFWSPCWWYIELKGQWLDYIINSLIRTIRPTVFVCLTTILVKLGIKSK